MTQPQTKPVKKRRRWLIVAFVLLLVSLIAGWRWPRGDARFVGKWQMISPQGKEFGQWELRSNGIACWTGLREGGQLNGKPVITARPPLLAQWTVTDDSFVIGRPFSRRTHERVEAVLRWLRRYAPNVLTESGMDCRILSVDANLVQLECQNPSPHPAYRLVIRRITE